MTVLFCDVAGSTGLGEVSDPEALRALLARYFERMKTIVELHGGTVEKFIGDAVKAVFGVPVQALIHAHRGEHATAERLAGQAVAIAERTDALNVQGDALCDLAEVLAAAGRSREAAAALEQALERYERKKNRAMIAQVKPMLEEQRKAAPA